MEGSDPVGLWETIVLASVNNQLRSAPLVDVIRWAEPARPVGENLRKPMEVGSTTNFLVSSREVLFHGCPPNSWLNCDDICERRGRRPKPSQELTKKSSSVEYPLYCESKTWRHNESIPNWTSSDPTYSVMTNESLEPKAKFRVALDPTGNVFSRDLKNSIPRRT